MTLRSSVRPAISLVVTTLAALVVTSCSGVTYPKERLVDSLKELLEREGLHAIGGQLVDHTLAVQLTEADLLAESEDGRIELGPAFEDIIGKAGLTIHRVLMSTDAEVTFYVLLMSDPDFPGIYTTVVRYMDDVKRAYASMIGPEEMSARTIFDLNYLGSEPMTLDQYVPREIHLEEFLSWQLARRIQAKLLEAFEESGEVAIGQCAGDFDEGEFVFTVTVVPAAREHPLKDETIREVFQTSTGVIAEVLAGYRFDSFETVRLIHLPTGRNFILPKARLEVFH